MKCFENLVLCHIRVSIPPTLDQFQFAYKLKTSTEDAVSTDIHKALSHLEHQQSYVRMLFIDYSSAFNTILPEVLIVKLAQLGLTPNICSWVKDFLRNRSQQVKIGPHTSSTITVNTATPVVL